MIHWIAETEAPVSRWMLGIAMLTIVTSTRSMKAAVITMASANQRRRSAGAAPAAPGAPTDADGGTADIFARGMPRALRTWRVQREVWSVRVLREAWAVRAVRGATPWATEVRKKAWGEPTQPLGQSMT